MSFSLVSVKEEKRLGRQGQRNHEVPILSGPEQAFGLGIETQSPLPLKCLVLSMNLFTEQKQTHRRREQKGGCKRKVDEEDQEVETSNCKMSESRREMYRVGNTVNQHGDRW